MSQPFPDPYVRSYQTSQVNDLIVFGHHAADKAENHVAFQVTMADYVTPPAKLREIASALSAARDAAAGHDDNRVAEQNALMDKMVRALDHNSYHIILLADFLKDESILHGAGYELKPPKTNKAKFNLLNLIPGVKVKHLEGVEGAILVILNRAKSNAIVELRMTETPDDEASWKMASEGIVNRARFEMRGLVPTRRIYLKARYHEAGAVGAWCQPVSIIVI
jgi:hypothetical protein